MSKPTQHWFDGPAGRLDARIHGPADGKPVLILHPHPLGGGSMASGLVHALATELANEGYRAVRFDFRGVRRSEGQHSDGTGETADALAVWDALAAEGPPPAVVGYSFGGGVAVHMAAARLLPALVLVAAPPAVTMSDLRPAEDAKHVSMVVHYVVGTQDPFIDRAGVETMRDAFPEGVHLHILDGAEHFLIPDHRPRAVKAVLAALAESGYRP